MLLLNKTLTWLQRPDRASQISSTPCHRAAGSGKSYFWLGLFLLTALLIQQLTQWRWFWLAELQGDSNYKQITGFGLLAFILYQWRLSVTRAQGDMRKALSMIKRHKLFGATAPLLFFIHSQALGYGYLNVLSLSFLLVFLTGLFNFEITQIRKPWFMPAWITVHVGSAMALLFLLAYHIYVSYAFK